MDQAHFIETFLDEIWNKKNAQCKRELYSFFSDNLVINSPIGKKMGASYLMEINHKWTKGFPDMTISSIDIEQVDNVIITNWTCRGRHQNDFQGISATNRKIEYRGETYFVFLNGKIVRYSCSVDLASLYSQLGFYLKQEEYDRQHILEKDKKLLIESLLQHCEGNLSVRESECLSLYLTSFSAKQIGKLFFISPRTVETHLQRALNKLNCTSKEECIDFMLNSEVLPLWHDLAKYLVVRKKSA